MHAIPKEFEHDVNALPPVLRTLVDHELVAGNSIVGVRYTFPAPPVGCCIILANAITTRPRASDDEIDFREVNGSEYSAQFTDKQGYFYVLEAPVVQPEPPGMDAIRERLAAQRPASPAANDSGVADAVRDSITAQRPASSDRRSSGAIAKVPANGEPARIPLGTSNGSALVDAFRASMRVDYEKWHDGTGYNLDLVRDATVQDRALIADALIPPTSWRDVEALAALQTETAYAALRAAVHSHNAEVRTAVLRYAPQSATDDERTASLVQTLQHGAFYGGLTSALDQVSAFHPPRVVNALIRGLFNRPGEIACHYAAMLWHIYGKSDDIFDWDQRPLFLQFNSSDAAERTAAWRALCALLDIDPNDTRALAGSHNEE